HFIDQIAHPAAIPEMVMRIDDRPGRVDDFFGVLREPVFARIGIEPASRRGRSADDHGCSLPNCWLLFLADQTPSRIMTVGVAGNVSREIRNVLSPRLSISNCLPIRSMKSSSGVSNRCMGSTTDARRRRVMSDIPSSDIV